ncbi:MAG: MaoC family dehydratase [Alphaproteobacteria bacterium]|uniref:MaoC family dehydratase n=1 Tax=Rhizobium/Agrobacterium group TaxID=227290 RepID=UPI0006B9CE20|nr:MULTISPECIES: MaoC family dehydratase [Rhizobium/Agrobacterium group]MBU0737981.1 MaoC family dehydratase [Alphaproteobacteria bacterium]MDM7981852.1 MaoC family dehydratase [Rhizobium sp.]AOG11495.1 maoC like domain protein [Agrobacterium sp. RAC06]KPF60725.1 Nodulation protein N [Rhizobium sp. AAP116]MBU0834065.1 MaoC family dehydratase [Alphaproteobacteria bacterium]
MPQEISLKDVPGLVGTVVGVSDWITVDQPMIDAFAGATMDHQFIHTDPVRAAAETPFGGTIAHGFLTLSLLSAMNYNCLPKILEQTMGINYGFEKVRFMSPVRTGKRIRGSFKLAEARFRGAGMLMNTYEVTVEIEDERKAALTADWITISQFDPKDRPEGV